MQLLSHVKSGSVYETPNKYPCVFCKPSDIPGHQADQTNLTGLGVRASSDLPDVRLCLAGEAAHFSVTHRSEGRIREECKLKAPFICSCYVIPVDSSCSSLDAHPHSLLSQTLLKRVGYSLVDCVPTDVGYVEQTQGETHRPLRADRHGITS